MNQLVGPLACLAVTVTLAACSADDGSELTTDGAGSPMDAVLVVPEGTELVGTVFPAAEEGNWDAVLLVTGDDPLAVLRDLVDQTEDVGYDLSTLRNNGAACEVFRRAALECSAYASRQGSPETYEFALRWGNLDGASFRHVLVRRRSESIWLEPNLTSVESDLPAPPEPVDDWEAPAVGDPVAAPPEAFDETVVQLEAGGRVLGPAAQSWSGTGGFNVVVALDDNVDVDDVVAAYAAQFEDRGFEGEISKRDFEGRSAVAARYTAAGGGEIEAVAVAGSEEEQWFVLLSRADD